MTRAPTTSSDAFGVLGIGQSNVALSTDVMREVVALPHALTPAPMAPAFALGAFKLRDELIPVIDLARLLQLDDSQGTRERDDQVAIVRWQEGHFGLRVDAIHGIAQVLPEHMQPLDYATSDATPLTPAAFTDGDRLVYVLDLDALFALPGMMLARASHHDHEEHPGTRQPADRKINIERALLIDCGGIRLSLPAAMVREIQPLDTLSAPVMDVSGFMGTTTLRRQTLAVFDPRVLAGLDDQPRPEGRLMVVVAVREQPLALCVNQVIRMMTYNPDDVMALAETHDHPDATIAGMIDHPQLGESLLVDAARFARDTDILTLAAMYIPREGHATRGEVPYRRFAFVHFDAFGQFVTPLEQLSEVIAMPEDFTPSPRTDEGWTGTLAHRGQAVSLVDLRQLLNTPHETPATDVLIVACGEYRVGFMIDNARHIEYLDAPADSLIIRWRGEQEIGTPPIEQCKRLIVVGTGAHKKVLSVLCLETLAALLVDINSSHHCSMIDSASPALSA
ncbi:chemotaxis protein CheW [Kushneria indalinina]|uniref:Chemotaxis signal transduction protein n=1 Tax=Kushneria indalinina DSM 14324 TaxID=1122140 RepID=A0A3D9DXL9_9GAMM|nr:chemotaxis protein CheW [Kushneria indalinina]REC95516.1 chemotaxis signal transduction protein [Kushneria indalinina DSM 14324]